jgi:hypothetical protein
VPRNIESINTVPQQGLVVALEGRFTCLAPRKRVADRTRPLLKAAIAFLCFFRALPSLAQVSPATMPDAQFVTSGSVLGIAVQEDGKVLIGGFFSLVNGVARTNIARLNANGALDETWNPGANDAVRQIVVSGTDIFALGDFTAIGGQSRNRIAKLSATGPGAVDPLWNPDHPDNLHALAVRGTNLFVGGLSYLGRLSTTGTGAGESPWGPQPDYNIFALALSGSDLYVAGNFSQIGGANRSRLAEVSTLGAGAVDPVWDPGATGGNLGTIKTLSVSDSYLYVGGSFDQIGGQSRKNIARLSLEGGGVADPIWDPGTDREAVYALAVGGEDGEDVYAGGSFSQIGGFQRIGLAKLSASGVGAADPSWNADTDGALVTALALSGSSIFAGGAFATIQGAVSLSVARLNGTTGARDDSFPAQAGNPGTVLAVARQLDGKVIVGGDFYLVGGVACRNLARFNVGGTLDNTWLPVPDGPVTAIAIQGTDIFIAGAFMKVGGQNRRFLAKFSATGTDAADATWDPHPSNPVDAIVVESTNVFVASSGFVDATIAKLSAAGAGQADPGWNPGQFECFSCPPLSPLVRALAADTSNVYVAGDFESILQGTDSLARNGLAKVDATGTGLVDGQWDPSPEGAVHSLSLDNTNLYVGGDFTRIGGQNRNALARVSSTSTGAADPGWDPELSGGYVEVLALTGTNLYAGGLVATASGLFNAPLVRLVSTGSGTVDPTWDPRPQRTDSTPGHVAGLAANGTDVFVVGDFDAVGGARRDGFAFLTVAGAPRIIQDQDGLRILRNADDGPEVTHFRISGLEGISLFQGDGVTSVQAGEFVTVEQGSAGLRYLGAGTITAVSAINDTPAGAGTAATTLNLGMAATPVFTSETYSGDGKFQFALRGEPNFQFVIQASADLLLWIPLSTNVTDAGGSLEFIDQTSVQAAQRYYRVQQIGPP